MLIRKEGLQKATTITKRENVANTVNVRTDIGKHNVGLGISGNTVSQKPAAERRRSRVIRIVNVLNHSNVILTYP
ncbi:MAG: hypothetical protein M2R45_02601 [Verrucomicrobia subdivision 3 bacterium]|nr:hypothetical protein [Limisphaerales bacterium]MCS1416431.1 hypothetical protein [Limisphaerales bacterium]